MRLFEVKYNQQHGKVIVEYVKALNQLQAINIAFPKYEDESHQSVESITATKLTEFKNIKNL